MVKLHINHKGFYGKIKESKELIDALYLLYKFGLEASKDGLDWSDAAALGSKIINDDDFRER